MYYNPFHTPILINLENLSYFPIFGMIFPFKRELVFKMLDYLGTPHVTFGSVLNPVAPDVKDGGWPNGAFK